MIDKKPPATLADAFRSMEKIIELIKIEQAKTASHDALLRLLVINNPNRENMTNAYNNLIRKYSQSPDVDPVLLKELHNVMKYLDSSSHSDDESLHNLWKIH